MTWPCPNGCPRDAGDYCDRHLCESCCEVLKPGEHKLCQYCDFDSSNHQPHENSTETK